MDSFAVADLYQTGSSVVMGVMGNPDKDLNGF
jgi:hypothetical protein